MKNKVLKKYTFQGLGFPVVLKNVPTIRIRGEICPDINYNELQKAVLFHLCHKQTPLTGNEIKFIRSYFEMTLIAFGEKFGVSHVAVLKWEKRKNWYAKIEPTTDLCIRLFVSSHMRFTGAAFMRLYNEIDVPKLARFHKQSDKSQMKPLAIDLHEDLKMAVGC